MPTLSVASRTFALATALTLLVAASAVAQQEQNDRAQQGDTNAEQLTEYFADKLMLFDRSECELSQIAAQQATSPLVKQYAQSLIQDHSDLDEQIAKLSPETADRFADHDGQARDEDRPRQTRTAAREDSGEHAVLTELCMINHRTADSELARSKKMLDEYEGEDFDMAYLGMQIGGHTWLLSELEAIQNVGTPQFQKLVADATKIAKEHLEKAQELTEQLEHNHTKASS